MSNPALFVCLADESLKFKDDRGSLDVLYESNALVLKRSTSKKGVFRGLHHQGNSTQHKIIRVVSGRIIDFVADVADTDEVVWYCEIGPEDNWVHIDSELAHGFYALDTVVFEYICDGKYCEDDEQAFCIASLVKSQLSLKDLIMSPKDAAGRSFGKVLKSFNRS
jgi:dTDP-4-dehydrorhamnose 3,5-epimerase